MLFTACKKSDNSDLSGENIVVTNPQTSEDHKQNLQKTGVNLTSELQTLSSQQAMDVMASLSYYLGSTSASLKSMPLKDKIVTLSAYAAKKTDFAAVLKTAVEYSSEITSEAEWAAISGTYTYVPSTKKFTYKKAAGSLTILFPSSKTGTSNNAKIVIDQPEWYTGTIAYTTLNSEVPTSVPSKIHAALLSDNTSLLSIDYALTMGSNGYPSNVSYQLNIGEFSVTAKSENNQSTTLNETIALTHGSNSLINLNVVLKGDWTTANINNSWVTKTTTDYWGTYTSRYLDFSKIAQNATVNLQVENIKMTGSVDIKGLTADVNTLQQQDLSDSLYSTQLAALVNKYASEKVTYDNGQLIATIIPTVVVKTETYWWSSKTYKVYDVEPLFVFADNSKVDPKVYFSAGWNDVISAFNSLISSLNGKVSK
jgi:hypothetical protein